MPDLGSNIKCGNSLIGPDFYSVGAGHGLPGLSVGARHVPPSLNEEEMYRINPFDWQKEFPEIMKQGGFDAVIGNPPYTYIISSPQQDYFSKNYQHQNYQKDLYLLFLERYEYFLKFGGLLGVIVSNTWLQSVTYRKIRQYLTSHYYWLRVLHLPERVFKAVVDTHVLIFQKSDNRKHTDGLLNIDVRYQGKIILSHILPWQDIPRTGEPINIIAPIDSQRLFSKIKQSSSPLMKICMVYNGAKPFEKGKGIPPQTEKIMKEKPYVQEGNAPNSKWSPLLRGSLIRRYESIWNRDYWILYGPWLAAPRNPSIFDAPLKIMVRQTGDSIIGTLVEQGFIGRDNLHIILPLDTNYDLRYILGIMNSRLIDFAYGLMNPEKGEALAQVKKQHVEQLTIHIINFSEPTDKARHDRMVKLVEQMLTLHKQSAATKTPDDKTRLQRQIDATDQQINLLVYELYGLMEKEIRIVESNS